MFHIIWETECVCSTRVIYCISLPTTKCLRRQSLPQVRVVLLVQIDTPSEPGGPNQIPGSTAGYTTREDIRLSVRVVRLVNTTDDPCGSYRSFHESLRAVVLDMCASPGPFICHILRTVSSNTHKLSYFGIWNKCCRKLRLETTIVDGNTSN